MLPNKAVTRIIILDNEKKIPVVLNNKLHGNELWSSSFSLAYLSFFSL